MPAGGLPALPAPAELLKLPSTTDDERWYEGEDYYGSLPNARVAPAGFGPLTFSPQWDPAISATPSDLAYAGFVFYGYETYAGGAKLFTGWESAELADVWLALADFQAGRWRWFNSPFDPEIDLPDMAPFIAPDGRVFLVVMVMGTTPATLDWVLVGDPIAPSAQLRSDMPGDPQLRIAPLDVVFTTGESYTRGSHIINYEIDFDGDGNYDDSGMDISYPHTYGPGDYTARLRVTDSLGQQNTQEMSFHVINPANQAPTASFTPDNVSGDAPQTVNFDASASMDPDGVIAKYEWDFDGDGKFDYSSTTPAATYTFSIYGFNTVQLRVTDADLATDGYTGQVFCNTGWRQSILATGVNGLYSKVSATVQGSAMNARACVAYMPSGPYSLHFIRSSASSGLTWDAPVTVVAGSDGFQAGFSPSIVIESMTQAPCIAYGALDLVGSGGGLMFIRATSNTGQNWNPPVTVQSGQHQGESNCLAVLGGKLTIATVPYAGLEGNSSMQVFQAGDSLGTTWSVVQQVAAGQTGVALNSPQLLAIPGQAPLLAWTSRANNAVSYYAAVAGAMNGSTWGQPLGITAGAGMIEGDIALGLAGGQPAMCMGTGAQGGELYFTRADNMQGTSWTSQPAMVDPADRAGASCTLGQVGGKPVIAYRDVNTSSVRYLAAADAAGTSWGSPMVVDSAGSVGDRLTLIVMPNDIPLVVYHDNTNQQLKAAAFF